MCAFFYLRWYSECSLSSGKEAVAVLLCLWVFARPVYFFLNVLRLQLHYFFPIPTICFLKTWNHQCFVLNLVITDSLTIHSPPFFASLQYYTVPFSACFSYHFLMCIRTVDKLLLLLKQKTGREGKGSVCCSQGDQHCVYRVDYSLVQILGVRVRGRGSGMSAVLMWH